MNEKKKRFLEFANKIKALGYRVFVSKNPGFYYGHIINENGQVGYFQLGDFGYGIRFSTVHKPRRGFGTGFSLDAWDEEQYEMTKEVVDKCFIRYPDWAKGMLEGIQKYTLDEWLAKTNKWGLEEELA